MSITHRILVVDDEQQIQLFLKVALEAVGYQVLQAENGAQAVRFAASMAPEAVILDLGLPDRDGKDVLADIRAFSAVPIIVLSARDQEAEKIAALDLGADDYIEKPFGIGELLARLRAAKRHVEQRIQEIKVVEIDDLHIDLSLRRVARSGEEIHLTPKEFGLLELLVNHAGRVLTHRQILAAVWGPAHTDDTQYLRVFVGQLRGKIDSDPAKGSLIRTELGIGYRFSEI